MNYRMAVRTHGAKVFIRIHPILRSYLGQGLYVMNMNEARCERTVTLLKKDVADSTREPEVCDTRRPSLWVPFVCVHEHGLLRTLRVSLN